MDQDKLAILNKKYAQKIKQLFGTDLGKEVLAKFKADYIYPTSFNKKGEVDVKGLAIKEFIQEIILLINDPRELDDIIIKEFY